MHLIFHIFSLFITAVLLCCLLLYTNNCQQYRCDFLNPVFCVIKMTNHWKSLCHFIIHLMKFTYKRNLIRDLKDAIMLNLSVEI